jgi:hypothetical protein
MSPLTDKHFYNLENLDSLTLDTIVKKKRTYLSSVIKKIGQVGIQFAGNSVMESNKSDLAIRFIVDPGEFPLRLYPVSPIMAN